MDIPALSVMLNQGKVQQQASLSVMKLAMGVADQQGNAMTAAAVQATKMAGLSVQQHLGANVDMLA